MGVMRKNGNTLGALHSSNPYAIKDKQTIVKKSHYHRYTLHSYYPTPNRPPKCFHAEKIESVPIPNRSNKQCKNIISTPSSQQMRDDIKSIADKQWGSQSTHTENRRKGGSHQTHPTTNGPPHKMKRVQVANHEIG